MRDTCRWMAALLLMVATPALGGEDHPALFTDAEIFEKALASVQETPARKVAGITVPHHLVAADLVALGFRSAAGREVRRIILLTPEHFKRSPTPIATTRRGFGTVWGRVPTDRAAVDLLLAGKAPISEAGLFDKEHGVHALLPFVARLFPKASVVPVALRIDSKPEDWQPLIEALLPLVDESTLIVQSTDFSHYLDVKTARRRDQETMSALAAGDPEAVLGLRQPDHLDSRAAQYIHMTLQQRLGNSGHVILANRNSQDYSGIHQERTTSYVVQLFEKEQGPGWPLRNGEQVWYFGGDTFFGRYVFSALTRPERWGPVRDRVLEITRGEPLVVNLEGVMAPRVQDPKAQRPLVMRDDFTLGCLKELHVRVAGLANNHALDLGPDALERMAGVLKENGIEPLRHGQWLDLGKFRIAGLTDLSNGSSPRFNRLRGEEISRLMEQAGGGRPAIAFVHWGEEWRPALNARQEVVLGWLAAPVGGGVEGDAVVRARPRHLALVLGSHAHAASEGLRLHAPDLLVAPSMGNLIFDQPRGTGALVEVRFFPCGTHAVRWIPLGNVLSGHSDSSTTKPFFHENPAGTR